MPFDGYSESEVRRKLQEHRKKKRAAAMLLAMSKDLPDYKIARKRL